MSQTPPPPTPTPPATNQPASGTTAPQQTVANTMLEVYQKNFAALTAATSTLSQSAATLFQTQQEALTNAVQQAATTSRETIAACAPQGCPDAVARFKQALDTGLTNLKQMSELTAAARQTAFATIQARMTELLQGGATPRSLPLGNLTNQPAGTAAPTPVTAQVSVAAQPAAAPPAPPPPAAPATRAAAPAQQTGRRQK